MAKSKRPTVEPNGNLIVGVDGDYFPIHFEWLPQVGDLVDLYSFIDAAAGRSERGTYKVIQVVHRLRDVSHKVPGAGHGFHWIDVHVAPARSKYFRDEDGPEDDDGGRPQLPRGPRVVASRN